MSDGEKRRRADFVVPTGLGRNLTLRHLRMIVTLLKEQNLPHRHRAAST
jgi:dephospho-CoA kinase